MSALQFISLTFNNFKTFSGLHEFDLVRQPGLYYITGANKVDPGLGANGVGKSTLWDAMLWCLFAKTDADKRPAGEVIPWFISKGNKTTSVLLHVKIGKIDYWFRRERNPNHFSVQVGTDGELREIQQEEVTKLLGMTEEMFRRTLVLGQTGKLFLDLRAEEQAQMFTEALQLDIWLRAIERASEAVKENQKRVQSTTGAIDLNKGLLEQLTEQIERQTRRAASFEEDREQCVRKTERGIAKLEEDLATATDTDNSVEKPDLPNRDKLDAMLPEMVGIRDKTKALHQDLSEHESIFAKLDARKKLLAKQGVEKKCIECGNPISDKEHAKKLQDTIRELQALMVVLSSLEAEFAASNIEMTEFANRIDAETAKYKKRKDGYSAALDAWSAWNKKVSSIAGELSRWKADLVSAKKEINQAEVELVALRKRRAELRAKRNDLLDVLANAEIWVKEAEYWVNAFREIRLSIIDQTLIELEMAASRHAAMLGLNDWGIKFDTERETKSGTVSYGFSVMLYPPGVTNPIKWESYSGGERQRWQLAVSFGLSEVLLARAGIAPNFEVLDEPTKGLSGVGVDDLLEHLRDRALELKRAIYFVDHHSLDKGAFDGTLVVEKTSKGSSFKWT